MLKYVKTNCFVRTNLTIVLITAGKGLPLWFILIDIVHGFYSLRISAKKTPRGSYYKNKPCGIL